MSIIQKLAIAWYINVLSMKYSLSFLTGYVDRIGSFTPLSIGSVIGWGTDIVNADGIARWKVVRLIVIE